MISQVASVLALFILGVTSSPLDYDVAPDQGGINPGDTSVTEDQPQDDSKMLECLAPCHDKPDALQCGQNGEWFLNSCYRECTNVAVAKDEKDCDMEEKKQFETSRGCEKKCSKTKPEPECGADTNYYDNKCWRECYGVKLADKKVCDDKIAIQDCEMNCFKNETQTDKDMECGVNGQWFPNKCVRECNKVELGQAGKECATQEEMKKYWTCQTECSTKGTTEVCGKSGHLFQNECHMKCTGEKPGEMGKDCIEKHE